VQFRSGNPVFARVGSDQGAESGAILVPEEEKQKLGKQKAEMGGKV
jgi:hypothetical protein